ncbi:hypothetical protein PRIPAC_71719 [Pristionchus pacificus]|uniref:Uncharacterized protein n=1 Tax=Pristionchus pacificus TaxID=54126 RepID=A0A2A6C905_PRIPA|nr:hypothetical protein PRIPAC_71719 [Pristionchus pacificus]|eukprot:PDM74501.1 hypothetical protein PRIPAC_41857 [Pristionchus pacificus]
MVSSVFSRFTNRVSANATQYPHDDKHDKSSSIQTEPVLIPDPKKAYEHSLFNKCFIEFLGDLIFVFAGTMQGYINNSMDAILHAAFLHGLAIFMLKTALGHIGGGHFNPAVSLGGALGGHLPLLHLPLYVGSQLLGGICGSLLTYAVLSKEEFTAILAGATLLETDTNTWYQGIISESMISFMLVHTSLNATMGSADKVLGHLAAGMTVTIGIIAAGRITGASMNPARSFGPNLIGWIFIDEVPEGWWEYHYIYWVGPGIGACIAAAIYWLFERTEKRVVR